MTDNGAPASPHPHPAPSASARCAPGTAASTSPSNRSSAAPSRGSPTPPPGPPASSPTTTPTCPTSATSPRSTGAPSNPSTCCAPGTRASRSATPATARARTTRATSGRTSRAPSAYYDPDGHCLRTSQATLDWGLPTSSPTLPASGSMRNGCVYQRPPWAPPTSETASSSSLGLPTPAARDWRGGRQEGQLPTAVTGLNGVSPLNPRTGRPVRCPTARALLPTPSASEATGAAHTGQGGLNLRTAVSLLPTPRATDGTKGSPQQRGSKGDLTLPSAAHKIARGALTPTPSDAGRPSSDAPPPPPPTLWDA